MKKFLQRKKVFVKVKHEDKGAVTPRFADGEVS